MTKGSPRHKDKTPVSGVAAAQKQVPEYAATAVKQPIVAPNESDEQTLTFRFDILDESNWPLHSISTSDHKRLIKRLKHFERLTLKQAKDTGALGEYDMKDCKNKRAAKILREAHDGRDDLTKLVIAPSGPLRMFGLREGSEIHLLWWDSKHSVWPEGKIVR